MNALEEKLLNRQEAFEEGEAVGLKIGEEKAKESQRTIIANMLKKGMDKMDIAEITGLPMEEIKFL